MKRTITIVAAVAAVTLFATLASCTAQQAGGSRQRIEDAEARLADLKAHAEAQREEAEARGDTESTAAIDKGLAELAKWQAELAKARAAITAAQGPDGSIGPEGIITAAAPLLPPPWNVLALLGGPLVVGGIAELRRRRTLSAAERVIDSIDVLREKDPTFDAAFRANAHSLSEWQGAEGVALVKAVRSK